MKWFFIFLIVMIIAITWGDAQSAKYKAQSVVKVYFCGAEDDLHVNPADYGRVDFIPEKCRD